MVTLQECASEAWDYTDRTQVTVYINKKLQGTYVYSEAIKKFGKLALDVSHEEKHSQLTVYLEK